jgi:hypothetical protein
MKVQIKHFIVGAALNPGLAPGASGRLVPIKWRPSAAWQPRIVCQVKPAFRVNRRAGLARRTLAASPRTNTLIAPSLKAVTLTTSRNRKGTGL